MKEDDPITILVIIVIVLISLLIDGNNMTSYQVTEAIAVCEVNGGLNQVEVGQALAHENVTAYCNNGAQFSIRYSAGTSAKLTPAFIEDM